MLTKMMKTTNCHQTKHAQTAKQPSTTRSCPVTKSESPDARNRTASATCLALKNTPFSLELCAYTSCSSSISIVACTARVNGVANPLGETQFTLIPCAPAAHSRNAPAPSPHALTSRRPCAT